MEAIYAERHDEVYKREAVGRVTLIYEDYSQGPIQPDKFVLIIISLIKKEIQTHRENIRLDALRKRLELEER